MRKIIPICATWFLTFLTIFVYLNFYIAANVSAQTTTSDTPPASLNYKIPNPTKYSDLESVINAGTAVARVVFVLTFAGIILYGGFVRLTSGGDEKKVEQSSKIITAGIVGFAIIVFAQPITEFVARLIGVQGGLFAKPAATS